MTTTQRAAPPAQDAAHEMTSNSGDSLPKDGGNVNPIALPVKAENIPAQLKAMPNWVVWRYEFAEGRKKPAKPPFDPKTGRNAKTNNPADWSDFAVAMERYRAGGWAGVGLVLTPDLGTVAVDMDRCVLPGGEIEPWAQAVLDTLPTSYIERSPSGTGLRAFHWGQLPEDAPTRRGGFEWYSGRTPSYLTVCGQPLGGVAHPIANMPPEAALQVRQLVWGDQPRVVSATPEAPTKPVGADLNATLRFVRDSLATGETPPGFGNSLSNDAILERMFAANGGDKLRELFDGNDDSVNGDASVGDLKLCNVLSFWTNKDPIAMNELFLLSDRRLEADPMDIYGDFLRGKWDRAAPPGGWSYRERTIAKAIASCTSAYTDPFQTERGARPVGFSSLADLLQEDVEPDWLIEGILDSGTLAQVFGEPGSMKSFLALDLGVAIAAGEPVWHGREVHKSGPVFILCGEGRRGIARRLKARVQGHPNPENIKLYVSDRMPQPADPDSVTKLVEEVQVLVADHGPPALLVVDTAARASEGLDENSAKDMGRFVAGLDEIRRELGCGALLVHHAGLADKSRGRGSSAVNGALDWSYSLTVQGDTRILSCVKCKDHEAPAQMAFLPEIVELGRDSKGKPVTSIILKKADVVAQAPGRKPLRGAAKIALDTLRDLALEGGLDAGGEEAMVAVPLEAWREACIHRGVSPAGTREAGLKAFNRAASTLTAEGYVKAEGDRHVFQAL